MTKFAMLMGTPRGKAEQDRSIRVEDLTEVVMQLASLVPNAKHITNTNSGHEIHKEQPELVIDAIRQVVEAVRSGDRQLAGRIRPLRQ